MKVSFEGIGEMVATLPVSGTVERGQTVKLTSQGAACACSAGNDFIGTAVSVRNGFAGVQVAGLVQVAYSGTAPACGWATLEANGSGGVRVSAAGTEQTPATGRDYLVLAVDTAAKTAVVRL